MLANSLDDGSLPSTVAACTNVTPLEPTTIAGMTNAELAECFSNAQRCNSHTQPLPSGPKAVKRFRLSLEDFDSSQLNPFLYGYLYQSGEIPDSVLDDILTVCVNSDAVWAGRCQQLAFNLVAKELEAKAAGMVPRDNEDDPIALPQLRNVLPTVVSSPPRIRMRTCSILFVGTLGESEEYIDQHYSASLLIQNKGKRPVSAVITQIKTLIDGVHTDDPLVEASLQDEIPPEGSADMKFRVKKLQNLKFSEIQQLYVLTIDSVMRYFVSFTVIAPHRLFEPLKFPRCVAVRVERSPLPYEVPLVLQVLKHQLIRQRGLTSAAVAHLMMPNSVNFRLHNHEVIRQALELRNTMNINEDVMDVLHSFWNSIPEKHRTENMAFHRPPRTLSEPPGFARGVDIPTGSSGCCVDYFPNAMTKLPEALLLAPAEVIMGMILLCLSDMDCCVFDTTVIHCDPVEYVSTISPATKGILIWILDLCCALLMNASANGLTVRALALTFTSVLVRHSPLQLLSGDKTRSFSTEVVLHQHAVTALITWISLFMELHP